MDINVIVRLMTKDDFNQIKQIIDLSFPIFYRFFAAHSINEEGHVLLAETSEKGVGLAKLISFQIEGKKYSCILRIAVHPSYRRKGIAAKLTNRATQCLKQEGANTVFASTQRKTLLPYRF